MSGDSSVQESLAPSAPRRGAVLRGTSPRAWLGLGGLALGYVAIDILAGVSRSPLVPVLPSGVGVPGWTSRVGGWIRLDRLGPVALVVVTDLVLAFLLFAFGAVAWESWKGRVPVRVAVVGVAVSLSLSVAAPLLLSRDVYSYAAYGRILSVHHANPYDVPPGAFPGDPFTRVVSREWLETRSVYGPGFTLASAGIARAWARSPAGTIYAFKVLAAVAVLAAVVLAARIARLVRAGREALAVVLLGLNPVVVVHTVGGGHNDALMAGLLAGACLCGSAALSAPGGARNRRDHRRAGRPMGLALGATVLITLAGAVKVVAFLPLVYWLWTLARSSERGLRARVVGSHLAVAAGITAALTAPLFAGWRTVSAIANLASREGWASGARLVARGAEGVGRGLGSSNLGSALAAVVYIAFLAAFAVLAWRLLVRTQASTEQPDPWGTSLLLFVLAAPYLLPWYAVWFLPFVALVRDHRLAWVGLGVAALLALTGVPAEPSVDPRAWRSMLLGVHYAIAPAILALFVYAAKRVLDATARSPHPVGPSDALPVAPTGFRP